MTEKNKDDLLMDHDYDGIEELDNNLPPWWVILFIVTIVWGVFYYFYWEWSGWAENQHQEYITEMKTAKANMQAKKSTEAEIVSDVPATDELVPYADADNIAAGKTMFNGAQICFTCHLNDGGGSIGPNLADEYWLNGGDFKSIVENIKVGFPAKGMPPYGNGSKISDEKVRQIASFVWSLQGTTPATAKPVDMARAKKWVNGKPVSE
jgi:cytochrome c oxidase cbb3-type subunit 3